MSFFRSPFAAAAAALVLSACGPQAQPSQEPSTENPSQPAPETSAGSALPRELDPLFAQAAREFDVPADLLKAVSYAETRWQMVQGTEEFPGQQPAFGLMALRGADLEAGAALAGVSVAQARTDALSNLRAGAARLSQLATDAKVERGDLGAWAPVVAQLSGITHPDAQAEHVHREVYAVLKQGAVALNPDGSVAASLVPVQVEAKFALPPVRALAAGPDYSAAVWRPSPNYGTRPSGSTGDPSMIIIHTCEGSYSSCWSWLTNSQSQVSAHYVVNESGSEVSQLVRESGRAWHIGATYDCSLNGSKECWLNGVSANHFTIGIEHGGFASQTSFPTGQIDASAKLSCDIARDNAILKDSYHIVAHGRLQPSSRTDPGPNWPWSTYISKINSFCGGGGGGGAGEIIIDSNAANNDASKARFETIGTWTQGTSAGYYGSGYFYAATSPVSEPATFWFYLDSAQTRTIDGWWVAGTNRSDSAAFIAFNAAGANLGTATVSQQANGGKWVQLGTYSFTAGWNKVQLSRWQSEGSVVIADALRVR